MKKLGIELKNGWLRCGNSYINLRQAVRIKFRLWMKFGEHRSRDWLVCPGYENDWEEMDEGWRIAIGTDGTGFSATVEAIIELLEGGTVTLPVLVEDDLTKMRVDDVTGVNGIYKQILKEVESIFDDMTSR